MIVSREELFEQRVHHRLRRMAIVAVGPKFEQAVLIALKYDRARRARLYDIKIYKLSMEERVRHAIAHVEIRLEHEAGLAEQSKTREALHPENLRAVPQ